MWWKAPLFGHQHLFSPCFDSGTLNFPWRKTFIPRLSFFHVDVLKMDSRLCGIFCGENLFLLDLLIWNYWLSLYHHMGVLKMKAAWREAEPRIGKRSSLITSFQAQNKVASHFRCISGLFSWSSRYFCFFVKASLSLELVSFAIYRVLINTLLPLIPLRSVASSCLS